MEIHGGALEGYMQMLQTEADHGSATEVMKQVILVYNDIYSIYILHPA